MGLLNLLFSSVTPFATGRGQIDGLTETVGILIRFSLVNPSVNSNSKEVTLTVRHHDMSTMLFQTHPVVRIELRS